MSHGKGSGLEWFIRRGQTIRGPFTSAKVRHYVLEERLHLDDEVSRDKLSWARLGSVAEVVPLQMRTDEVGEMNEGRAEQRKSDRGRALITLVTASLILVAVVAGVSWVGTEDSAIQRDCGAAPSPGISYADCDLRGKDLRAADLSRAVMVNVRLDRANLGNADLSKADLRYADLSKADLSYTKLTGANLKGANLRGADLTNADLTGADLRFADLTGGQLGGAVFSDALLEDALWSDGRRCQGNACP